ncbi:MAG: glycosyltransferase family 2 protein [Prevotellaceae bacterium]|jgi:dolichol-phosphate mannosyltransferase|nr:glycosyltransferase family 2 protein [Prevotellaceae bacterium]
MAGKSLHISIVSPVYKAEKIIQELVGRLHTELATLTDRYEIILVNDGSPDDSWNEILKEGQKDKRVKGLNLSRNFGQHYAITAGLSFAVGEWIVVMDCDLQDDPAEIPKLYRKAQEGYDSVFAQRIQRTDSFLKRNLSKLFYLFFSYLTDTEQESSVANFGIYHRVVIDAILSMKDQIRFFPTMVQWVGFRKYYLPVKHSERFEGETSYSFKDLFRLALNNTIAFSDKPLRLTVKVGFFLAMLSFMIGVVYAVLYFIGTIDVLGFTTLILSIWFLAGIVIGILGVLGLYVGKVFEKVKSRPLFIVQNINNV